MKGPRYRLVAFDLDGTLVAHHEPIWKTLHEACGSDLKRRKAVIKAALAGEISYAEWFAADLQMLQDAGATRSLIAALVADLSPTPGALELVRDLKASGAHVAVISGGVRIVADSLFPTQPFDALLINRLEYDEAGALKGGEATPFDREHKVAGLEMLAGRWRVPIEECAFVGDGPNDVAVAERAGFSIAWGDAHPELIASADLHVQATHLDALRPHLFL